MQPRKRTWGFSLVELVIVIVIIGIIAAIAIPRVGRGAKAASESSLASNLSVLRNAVELYSSEHNGRFPGTDPTTGAPGTAAQFVDQLTLYSDASGNTQATKDATHAFGPYLRKGVPPCPVGANKGAATVKISSATPVVVDAGADGWVYNPGTGDLIVNSDDNNEAGDKTYDEY